MNKDQKAGRIKKAKGSVKEVAGRITGDKKLEREGEAENAVGKVQTAFGNAKARLSKALDK
ncbi:MAG: CsbD family protein [Aquimonas sp.]|nr:CsbD family protein [Aquimonas sp.]